MSRASVTAWAGVLLTMGCSGAPAPTRTARTLTGEAGLDEPERAPNRLTVEGLELPDLPAGLDSDDPTLATSVEAIGALLAHPPPEPGDEPLRAFATETYLPWLDATTSAIPPVWSAMQHPGASGATQVVLFALTGLALSRVRERVAEIGWTQRGDRELRDAIEGAAESAQRAIRRRATEALGACATLAVGSADPTLEAWRATCDRALSRLDRGRVTADGGHE